MSKPLGIALAAAMAVVMSGAIGQAGAAPLSAAPLAMGKSNLAPLTQVHWRGRGFGGPGALIGGLAAGAIIGGALAAPRYYAPYPYSYGPAYAAPPPPPAVYAEPDDDNAVAYCMQRYRSYDPASGTYLGYDGYRHPCP